MTRRLDIIRRIAAAVAALLPLAGAAVAAITLRPRLGGTIASHWSSHSVPDGFSDTWPLFWVLTGVSALLIATAIVAIARLRQGAAGRLWGGIAVMTAGFLTLAWIVSALATVAAPSPDRATLGARMLLMIAAPACGALVALLVPSSTVEAVSPLGVEPVPLRPGERLAWTGVTGSRLFAALGLLLVVVGVAMAVGAIASPPLSSLWIGAVIFGLAGLSVLMLGSARLFVDARGVRLASTLFGVPLVRVRAADIAGVSAETIEPLQWGGWGLRFSGRGRAYVVGRGEGIVVTRKGGGAVAITMPHAAEAAAALQAVVDTAAR